MKTLLLTLSIILSSCSALKQGIHDHYILYNKTKALFVLEEKKDNKLIVQNAQGTKIFKLYDITESYNKSDTIIVKDNQWLFGEIKFLTD